LAKRFAAAFGVLGLRGSEKVSVYVAGTGSGESLRPTTGRVSARKVFAFLESIKGGGSQPIDAGIEALLRKHRGRGVVMILSDFLTAGDLKRSFNLLFNAGLEIFALQLLAPSELNPEITGDFRLVDSELDSTLDISNAADLLALYQEYRAAHEARLQSLCQQRSGRFLSVNAGEPFDRLFFEQLRKKGWVV
jgi:uncharacterized protein (DUF58 family)